MGDFYPLILYSPINCSFIEEQHNINSSSNHHKHNTCSFKIGTVKPTEKISTTWASWGKKQQQIPLLGKWGNSVHQTTRRVNQLPLASFQRGAVMWSWTVHLFVTQILSEGSTISEILFIIIMVGSMGVQADVMLETVQSPPTALPFPVGVLMVPLEAVTGSPFCEIP